MTGLGSGKGPGKEQATTPTLIPPSSTQDCDFSHITFCLIWKSRQLPCLELSGISLSVFPDVSGPGLEALQQTWVSFQDPPLLFRLGTLKRPQGLASSLLFWSWSPIDPAPLCPVGGSFSLWRESRIGVQLFFRLSTWQEGHFALLLVSTLHWKKKKKPFPLTPVSFCKSGPVHGCQLFLSIRPL